MDEMLELQGRLAILSDQRENEMNRAVILGGQLNACGAEVAALKQRIAELEAKPE